MSTKTHKKLCWNCDGYVHVYEMKCPYCGAGLSEHQEEKAKAAQEPSLSSTMEHQMQSQTEESFEPPYHSYGQSFEEEEVQETQAAPKKPAVESEDISNPLASLLLLIPGSVLFLLGLTAVLFSTDGVLTLQFKSKFGFFYLLIGLPLLYFGYRSIFPKKERSSVLEDSPYTNPLER